MSGREDLRLLIGAPVFCLLAEVMIEMHILVFWVWVLLSSSYDCLTCVTPEVLSRLLSVDSF